MIERLGSYRLLRQLGEGGMGVVWAAVDERLDRQVAIKLIREGAADEQARRRFGREARLIASVSHPGVCQLHEVGEHEGTPYLVMELLTGEPLSARLARGPLPPAEAVHVALAVLDALSALHEAGLVHRDLKPSNVFLTPHGVKLLDFGLARPVLSGVGENTESLVTLAGTILGTPHYMPPEQLQGHDTDARSDLFAVGAMLFEMLTGRHAFQGATVMEVFHATLYEQPPALGGSPGAAALDRVVRRSLAKRADDRFASASEMAAALKEATDAGATGSAPRVVAITRLIVLPFRPLRPDPETDFLAVSLPDAITSSLSGLDSLVVRSSLAAARFGSEAVDLRRIATDADVDVVLTGTLLRGGDQLRVSTQLVEAPAGTVLWTHTSQAPTGDVFRLEDELVHRIVDALALPLTAREHRMLKQDTPASPRAYEMYLRANPLALKPESWDTARALYEECLREDPRYAPAWARVGRVYRLLAKYEPKGAEQNLQRARDAFQRALEINPDLPLAHSLYAQMEVEDGRPQDALRRLVSQARQRATDPELFAGLVHVCRYCGLLEASRAAHAQARRLDPNVRTSLSFTLFAAGEFEAAAAEGDGFSAAPYALAALGRTEEAREALGPIRVHAAGGTFAVALDALLTGNAAVALPLMENVIHTGFRDPEGVYLFARSCAHLGARDRALRLLAECVAGGFYCVPAFERDPWLAPVRNDPRFAAVLADARARQETAAQVLADSGGDRLLALG